MVSPVVEVLPSPGVFEVIALELKIGGLRRMEAESVVLGVEYHVELVHGYDGIVPGTSVKAWSSRLERVLRQSLQRSQAKNFTLVGTRVTQMVQQFGSSVAVSVRHQ